MVNRPVAVSIDSLSVERLLKQALYTHRDLNSSDVEYAVTIIVTSEMVSKRQHFARFLTHVNRLTYIGHFSLTFNRKIDQTIISRNSKEILAMFEYNQDSMWPEVYHNNELTSDEKQIIMAQEKRETLAMYNTIDQASTHDEKLLYNPEFLVNGILIQTDKEALYEICYNEVCQFEGDVVHQQIVLHDESQIVNNVQLLPSLSPEDGMFKIRGYRILELMELFDDFDPVEKDIIYSRFSKEYKMYMHRGF